MLPYIVTYTLTFIVAWVIEKTRCIRNTKVLAVVFLGMLAAFLSLLAAFRADSIGTDVQTYVIRFFDGARKYKSFKDYLSFYPLDYVEPGYKLINFVISRFTDDIRFLHFFIAFFDVSFIMAYLWENKSKMSFSIGVLVFMLMLYNTCFNAVRQTMAICVCLYAFNSARDRRLKKFMVLILLAFLLHRSSLIMIVIYPLVWFFNQKSIEEKIRWIYLLTIISIGVLFFINGIVLFLIRIGLFPIKFSHYVGNAFSLSRLSAFIFVLPVVLLFILYKKKYIKWDSYNAVLFLLALLWPVLAQLDSVSDQFGRMAYYFIVANIGIYAQIPKLKYTVKHKSNIYILVCLLVVFLISYWILNYYIWRVGSTVPYEFG